VESSDITTPVPDSASPSSSSARLFLDQVILITNVVSVSGLTRRILIWEIEQNGYSAGVANGSMKSM